MTLLKASNVAAGAEFSLYPLFKVASYIPQSAKPGLAWSGHNKSYRLDMLTRMITATLTPSDWLTASFLASYWSRERMMDDSLSSGRLE